MKPLKQSFLLVFMTVMVCCNHTSTQQGLIIIQDLPANRVEPVIDLESHKSGDVEIHRVNTVIGEGYQIIYYHDISGRIRDYHFYQIDTTYYNQGFYNWKNDTIVNVKLYNSETKREFSIELFPSRDWDSSGGARLLD